MINYEYIKQIKSDRLQIEISNAGLSGLQYIDTVGTTVNIYFDEELTQEQKTQLDSIVQAHSSLTLQEIVSQNIRNASAFGSQLIFEASIENVLLGITQANKTKDVADYCKNIQVYLQTGSLYAALSEIETLLNEEVPSNLSPWITADRLNAYKTKIENYLGL